ncbi:hypothetical protein [Methylocystis bryophila]|uniref:hypothetical protein n=1 Tax=Methylocystis bryophila TaxID=655015 RepID=UPI00131A1CB9|nr:hypothetical protein [Methylocystis bryophila]
MKSKNVKYLYQVQSIRGGSRGDIAAYISELVEELGVMATNNNMPLLNYFLRMAQAEAESTARSEGVIPTSKQTYCGGTRH